MKRVDAAASLFLALGALVLAGCETTTSDASFLKLPFINIDPLNTDGRDGGGNPLDYAAL